MAMGVSQRMRGMGRLAGRLVAATLLTLGLSACAIPPAISLASLAADGFLLATTGKSKADHGLSLATGKDCATFRAIEGEDVCQELVVAQAEPLPAEVDRELVRLRAAPRSDSHARAAMAAAFRPAAAMPVLHGAAPPHPVAAADIRLAQSDARRLATLKSGKRQVAVKRARSVRATRLASHGSKQPVPVRAKVSRLAVLPPDIRLALAER